MPSNNHDDQPGLEVAPESELHFVEGPIIEKPYDGTNEYRYEQQSQASHDAVHQNNTYPSNVYPPSAYPLTSQPSLIAQAHPYWGGSQDGTYLTDRFPPSSEPPNSGRILGLRRKTFWLIFGPLIALLVIGLAVGLGVGLGTERPKATTTHPPSATSSSGTTVAPTPLVCPQANGTIYQTAGDDPFFILCNIDYNGNWNGGTKDIGSEETSTVEGCIDACADNSTCAGAGWGNYNGHNICWMKGSLGSPQNATNWFFVIRK